MLQSLAFADFFQAGEAFADVCASAAFLTCKIKGYLSLGTANHSKQAVFGNMLIASETLSHGNLFLFFVLLIC